jgi:hypothetical protein
VIQYGHLDAGSLASAPFELRATDRAVAIGVASASVAQWYVAAQVAAGAPFLRVYDPWSTYSAGCFWCGTGGGWGTVAQVPATTVRLESTAAFAGVVSFAVLELARS